MEPTPGRIELGPSNADLLLHTTCEGAMARMGHDLTLEVRDWTGELVVGATPGESQLKVTAQLGSLAVRESRGGSKEVSDGDRAAILKNAASSMGVAKQPQLVFTATSITGTWDRGRVEGALSLNGRSEVQAFDVAAVEDGWRLSGVMSQGRYGIKPYSALMGALRVADAVDVEVTLTI
ncbi:YceI family protein [Propionibacteriaceae bacterium G1746]